MLGAGEAAETKKIAFTGSQSCRGLGPAANNVCTYLQYADHSQCIHTATLPIGVKDGGKEEKKRKEKAVPRAAAAQGRQLKTLLVRLVLLIKATYWKS